MTEIDSAVVATDCWDEQGECATLFSRAAETSKLSTEQYDSKAWSETVSGVRFIGVDNSTQLVTAEQTSFVEAALAEAAAAGEPVVVMVHLPLYTPELRATRRPLTGAICRCLWSASRSTVRP